MVRAYDPVREFAKELCKKRGVLFSAFMRRRLGPMDPAVKETMGEFIFRMHHERKTGIVAIARFLGYPRIQTVRDKYEEYRISNNLPGCIYKKDPDPKGMYHLG